MRMIQQKWFQFDTIDDKYIITDILLASDISGVVFLCVGKPTLPFLLYFDFYINIRSPRSTDS